MIGYIWQAVALVNLIVVIAFMLKIRRAGEQDPMIADGLTSGERVLTIVTIFLGFVIIPASIYYYGWKKRFPLKARSVLHMEWIGIAIGILSVIAFATWYTDVILPIHRELAKEKVQITRDQLKQQQALQLQQQQFNLTSGTSEKYQGDGFTIQVPGAWGEDTYSENGWANNGFGQAKVWQTNDTYQELHIVWSDDMANAKLNIIEGMEKNDAVNFPDQTIMNYPTIPGATRASMAYPTKVQSDDYTIKLYAHGNGKVYLVEGSLRYGTDAQASALKQIILSLELTK